MLNTPAERCMCGFREVRVSVLENGGPELNLRSKGKGERKDNAERGLESRDLGQRRVECVVRNI